jgi:hypothetical protein
MFASCTLLIAAPGQACWKLWNLSFRWSHAPSVQKATMVCAWEIGREVAGDPIFPFHGRVLFIHLYSITSKQRIANILKFFHRHQRWQGRKSAHRLIPSTTTSDHRHIRLQQVVSFTPHMGSGALCQPMAPWILSLVFHGGGKPPSRPLFYVSG